MRNAGQRASPRFVLLVLPILLAGGSAFAQANIDPLDDGSQYAWAENLGWINLQPNGPGGDGVQVADTGLTGWAWAENAGWISLSCQNTLSCGTNAYGVSNDRCGTLSGYAWSANAGWITFSSTGPFPYQVATSWRLDCNDNNTCTTDTCSPGAVCRSATRRASSARTSTSMRWTSSSSMS